jgi:hypothetical protein
VAAVKLVRVGFDAFIGTLAGAIEAAKGQSDADVRLSAALKNVGQASQASLQQTKANAQAIQSATRFGDEYVQTLQSVLISLGGLTGGPLDRATRLTLDLAEATGIDAKAAALLFAKAAQGQTSALSRYGLVLDPSIPQNQKFAAVLDLVQKKFHGVAEEMSRNFVGRVQQIKNLWGDLNETLGGFVVDSEGVNAALTGIKEGLEGINSSFAQIDASRIITNLTLDTLRWAHALVSVTQAGVAISTIPFFGALEPPKSVTEGLEALREELKSVIERVEEVKRIRTIIDELLAAGPPTESAALRIAALEKRLVALGATSTKIRSTAVDDFQETSDAAKTAAVGLDIYADSLERIAVTGVTSINDQLLIQLDTLERAIVVDDERILKQKELLSAYTAQTFAVTDINALVQASGATLDTQTGLWISMADSAREAKLKADEMRAIGGAILNTTLQFSSTLVDAMFGARIEWGKLAKQMLADLAKAVIQAVIIKTLLSSTGFGAFFGFNQGGTVPAKAATGGFTRGGIQGIDSIPALLTPGEVVLNNDMVKKLKSLLDKPEAGGGFVVQNQFGSVITRDLVEKFVRKQNELAEHFGLEVLSTRTVV